MTTEDQSTKNHLMIVMWDHYGLESVIDVTKQEQEHLFDMISNPNANFFSWLNQTVKYMLLRAQANSQRNYEVYSIWVDENISADELSEQFEEAPQSMADLIRSRGNTLYRSSRGSRKQKIF
jgi:hypothetical protein